MTTDQIAVDAASIMLPALTVELSANLGAVQVVEAVAADQSITRETRHLRVLPAEEGAVAVEASAGDEEVKEPVSVSLAADREAVSVSLAADKEAVSVAPEAAREQVSVPTLHQFAAISAALLSKQHEAGGNVPKH